jgi:hypothetical protein
MAKFKRQGTMKPTQHPSGNHPGAAEKIAENQVMATSTKEIWQERVRKRAYELYLGRNRRPGNEVQDWLQAEAELLWKLEH